MTSLLAGIDPGSSPDALSGAEERSDTRGTETERRSCPEDLDDPVMIEYPVRHPCDR